MKTFIPKGRQRDRPGQAGIFLISLDFELYWGVRDKLSKKQYGKNILAVKSVIPPLLSLFERFGIHATWAAVGFLFFKNKKELLANLPERKPDYANPHLSPYHYIYALTDVDEDPFHFAPSLIKTVSSCPHQEIGTHTFSHYYCLEEGQTIEEFKADITSAIKAASRFHGSPRSLVFPRNQVNPDYLPFLKEVGITSYRGNEKCWIYKAASQREERWFKRGLRLMDAYVNLSGHNTYRLSRDDANMPLNLRSSRFLRPYSPALRFLEPFRLRRILSDLTHAAQKGEIYHLWWHPHNFGTHLRENLSFLENILINFVKLKDRYGIKSMNMGELSACFQSGRRD